MTETERKEKIDYYLASRDEHMANARRYKTEGRCDEVRTAVWNARMNNYVSLYLRLGTARFRDEDGGYMI